VSVVDEELRVVMFEQQTTVVGVLIHSLHQAPELLVLLADVFGEAFTGGAALSG
jgi:hypothetical protein